MSSRILVKLSKQDESAGFFRALLCGMLLNDFLHTSFILILCDLAASQKGKQDCPLKIDPEFPTFRRVYIGGFYSCRAISLCWHRQHLPPGIYSGEFGQYFYFSAKGRETSQPSSHIPLCMQILKRSKNSRHPAPKTSCKKSTSCCSFLHSTIGGLLFQRSH